MSRASRKHLTRIGAQTAGLALAAPQVVAHRVNRMMTAGPAPGARDLREFNLMTSEKAVALAESWIAMGAYMMRANQSLALTMIGASWKVWLSLATFGFPVRHAQQLQSNALGMISAGMAPVHRKAVANAKRLAGVKS